MTDSFETRAAAAAPRGEPFHCPYCGSENLWPHEVVAPSGEVDSPHGTWECRSCLRAFSLRMLGLLRRTGEAR